MTNRMDKVDKGTRVLNYIIDMVAISLLTQIIVILILNRTDPSVLFFLIYFLYYLVFESLAGRTLGKLVTGSKVVDRKNEKPNFFRIFFRTLLRFNPFDWLSYAFGQVQGTHDTLSRTKLVSTSKKP